ncbi:MAG TPA: hypothetical protein VH679_04265, partial [Vicinamibacterales bacterium]
VMRKTQHGALAIALTIAGLGGWILPSAAQQAPLSPVRETGQTVTPAFEGWYPNKDGTFSISFGYFNRNSKEVVEVPIGADNFIEPGDPNQNQPTSFQPGRHWGVFAVTVPKDFGDKTVTWTLKTRGETFAIPGRLHPNWQIDALEGEAGSGNTPPALKFAADGEEGSGPRGATGAPMTATAGKPLTVTVWARDDGKSAGSVAAAGRGAQPVTLAWFKHQGPGSVAFTPPTGRIPATGGSSPTAAVFSEPGTYVIRVRANDASGVTGGGHAQCCWTNGFVKVTVAK